MFFETGEKMEKQGVLIEAEIQMMLTRAQECKKALEIPNHKNRFSPRTSDWYKPSQNTSIVSLDLQQCKLIKLYCFKP